MSVDPNIEKFIKDNYLLMEEGDYDEVYRLALRQDEFEVSALTQFLWHCDIHPELEGLTEIPKDFAMELDVKTFHVPQGITSIGRYAFYGCTSLTSVTIPVGITSIGNFAFSWCSSLASITIPASITSIGEHAFWKCATLTTVMILDGVPSIENAAFAYCDSLTEVTIPASVTSIGAHAFYRCPSLEKIIFEGTKEQWKAVDKGSKWRGNAEELKVHCTNGVVKYR